jgi:hypothetical protein
MRSVLALLALLSLGSWAAAEAPARLGLRTLVVIDREGRKREHSQLFEDLRGAWGAARGGAAGAGGAERGGEVAQRAATS